VIRSHYVEGILRGKQCAERMVRVVCVEWVNRAGQMGRHFRTLGESQLLPPFSAPPDLWQRLMEQSATSPSVAPRPQAGAPLFRSRGNRAPAILMAPGARLMERSVDSPSVAPRPQAGAPFVLGTSVFFQNINAGPCDWFCFARHSCERRSLYDVAVTAVSVRALRWLWALVCLFQNINAGPCDWFCFARHSCERRSL
jgi:hypothetical protein